MRKFKKGDVVKVWSLQSFFGGGFIKGSEGVVCQDQMGDSVCVSVIRNIAGQHKLDPSYEVYPKQLELVNAANTSGERPSNVSGMSIDALRKLRAEIDYQILQHDSRP